MGKRAGALAVCVLLATCSALPSRDLRIEYDKAVRKIGLTPVYPPREEFQVGDVYFVSYDPKQQSDLEATVRIWLGTIQDVRNASNEYLATRIDLNDTAASGKTQTDFASGRVKTNAAGRETLPLVSFPAVSGSSATAGALGGFNYLTSFGLAGGQRESVTLDFGDTRAFGLPLGAVTAQGRYAAEFRKSICPTRLHNGSLLAKQIWGAGREPALCGPERVCAVQIVTRTYVTRTLQFTYTSAQIARFALSTVDAGAVANAQPRTETLPLPGNLDVSVNLDGSTADPAQLDKLIGGLTQSVEKSRISDTPGAGLSFVGVQGAGLVFKRDFAKPVTIAYEALSFGYNPDMPGTFPMCAGIK